MVGYRLTAALSALLWVRAGGLGQARAQPVPVTQLEPPKVAAPYTILADRPPTLRLPDEEGPVESGIPELLVEMESELAGPPGPFLLHVASSLPRLTFDLQPLSRNAGGVDVAGANVRTMVGMATAPGTTGPPRLHPLLATMPSEGRLRLRVSAPLPRTLICDLAVTSFELGRLFPRHPGRCVAEYALQGPLGQPQGQLPQRITMQSWQRGQLTRIRAALRPRYLQPARVGLTLGLGLSVNSAPYESSLHPAPGRGRAEGTLVLALDVALPHQHVLSLSGELGTNFQATHHASMALTYQIHHPLPPRSPLAAHLDLGVVVDFYQSLFPSNFFGTVYGLTPRVGPRLGIGALSRYAGLAFFGDLFPYPLTCWIPEGCGRTTPEYEYEYRLTVLATVGI